MYEAYRDAVDEEKALGAVSIQRWFNDWTKRKVAGRLC